MCIYVVLSKPLAIFLYSDPMVANFIHIMGYSTVLLALQHNFSGILYGLNKQIIATVNRLIGMIIQLILVYVLVGNPRFGIYGFFISFFSSTLITTGLDIWTLKRLIKFNFNYLDLLGKPLLGSTFMLIFMHIFTYDLKNVHNINPLLFVSSLLVGALSYIIILFMTKALPKDSFKRIMSNK